MTAADEGVARESTIAMTTVKTARRRWMEEKRRSGVSSDTALLQGSANKRALSLAGRWKEARLQSLNLLLPLLS